MSEACRHALGGAIPARRSQRPCTPSPPARERRARVTLAQGPALDPEVWPVRYQGPRGTCNAFAVNAAEELYRWLQDPDQGFVPLSDEYLYAMMRAIDLRDPRLNLDLNDREIAQRERAGVTYLAQARLALIENGVCTAELAPYTVFKPVNHRETAFSDAAHADAVTRKGLASDWQHHIVEPGEDRVFFGLDRRWEPPLERDGAPQSCSDIIHRALMDGTPVVAGFCVLDGVGFGAWFGMSALRFGTVTYPSDGLVGRDWLRPGGGHAVCIVGYDPGAAPGEGWFVFRNSFGAFGFSRDREADRLAPQALERGYGYIPERDVDRYCWEILHRTVPQAHVA